MTSSNLRLRPVRLSEEQHVRSAHQELGVEAFDFRHGLRPDTSWSEYVQQRDLVRRATRLPAPWVPAALLLAFVRDDLVGRTSIRHGLSDFLLAAGGRIGYAMPQRFRRRGFATEILTQSLVVARSYDVGSVLVMCDEDNDASARVITRCDGVPENVVDHPEGGPHKQRYWID